MNPWGVTLSNYVHHLLPKFDYSIPPTIVKDPIGDKEKACNNTSIYSFLEKFEPNSFFLVEISQSSSYLFNQDLK